MKKEIESYCKILDEYEVEIRELKAYKAMKEQEREARESKLQQEVITFSQMKEEVADEDMINYFN